MREKSRSVAYPAAAKILKIATNADARNELMKEVRPLTDNVGSTILIRTASQAALMALLKHPNIVELIGVVTTPRSMPALMLLAYCENGSLLDFLVSNSEEDIDASLLLSFGADVAAGMSYLSSRRIVHRDVSVPYHQLVEVRTATLKVLAVTYCYADC